MLFIHPNVFQQSCWGEEQTPTHNVEEKHKHNMRRHIFFILVAAVLAACSNHHYGFDEKTWESMSEEERHKVISESQRRLSQMEEENQFQKDVDGLIDWSGKGP